MQPCVVGRLAARQADQPAQQEEGVAGDDERRALAQHVAHEERILAPPSRHRPDVGPASVRIDNIMHLVHLPSPFGVRKRKKKSLALSILLILTALAGSTPFGHTSEQ